MTAGLARLKESIPPAAQQTARALSLRDDARLASVAYLWLSLLASLWPALYPWPLLLVVVAVVVRYSGGLACYHSRATYRRGIFGDEINARGGHRSEWQCLECDAVFTRAELAEPERDPVGLLFEEVEALALADVVAERDLLRKRLRGLAHLLAQRGLHVRWNAPQPVEGETHEDRLVSLLSEVTSERDKWKERYAEVSELYDRAREMIGRECDGCVESTCFDDERRQFQCTGRGRICRPYVERALGPGHIVELPGKVTPEEHRALTVGDMRADGERIAEYLRDAFRGD